MWDYNCTDNTKVKRKLKKKHWRWIIATVIMLVILLMPVSNIEQFATDTEQKLSILQVLMRSLVSIVKEFASLLSEVL